MSPRRAMKGTQALQPKALKVNTKPTVNSPKEIEEPVLEFTPLEYPVKKRSLTAGDTEDKATAA